MDVIRRDSRIIIIPNQGERFYPIMIYRCNYSQWGTHKFIHILSISIILSACREVALSDNLKISILLTYHTALDILTSLETRYNSKGSTRTVIQHKIKSIVNVGFLFSPKFKWEASYIKKHTKPINYNIIHSIPFTSYGICY